MFKMIHVAGTLLDLVALSSVIGLSCCLLFLSAGKGFPAIYADRVRRLLFIGLILLVISSIDSLIQRSIEMSGSGIASVIPLLPTVVFKTHFGHMWLVRLAGLSAAWLIAVIGRRRPDTRLFGLLLFCSAAMIAFSRSASGHPADFGDLSIPQIADWVHLLSVCSLAGALLTLSYVFSPMLVESRRDDGPFIAGIADRFYLLFGPLLAVLVATGMYNARFTVGSFQVLATTLYGKLFAAKIMLLLFLSLRFITPPAHGPDEAGYALRFIKGSRINTVLVLCILIIVSPLVHTIPARHEAHLARAQEPAPQEREGRQPTVLLETDPPKIVAGSPVRMTVSIREQDGKPLKGLTLSHERILHAIIISKDLSFFAHIHAEDLGPVTREMIEAARLPLQFTFPRAGEYLIGFDFAADEESFSKTVSVTVAEAPAMGQPKIDLPLTKKFGDYTVTLELSPAIIRAGADATLRFSIQKNGKPVTDLEPYLGASMHLAVVPVDLKAFIHAHGELPGEHHEHHDHLHSAPPDRFGPEIDAEFVAPAKGFYKIFNQVKHHGKILLFEFMVDVQ